MVTALKQEIGDRTNAGTPPTSPKQGKRRVVLPIVLVLAALGAFWGFKQWSYGRAHESTDDAAVDGHLVPVLSKVSGYVEAVQVTDNSHVNADSVVVKID